MTNPKATGVPDALGCVGGALFVWAITFGVNPVPVILKVVLFFVAVVVGVWAARVSYLSKQFVHQQAATRSASPEAQGPVASGETQHEDVPAQRGRTFPGDAFINEMVTTATWPAVSRRMTADITKRQRPYHVQWVGSRLMITPPPPPGAAFLSDGFPLRKRSWWSFSPGGAELTTSRGSKRSTVTRYVVEGVEIAHDVWTSGGGVTDSLLIKGPGYAPTMVAALEFHNLFDFQRTLGNGTPSIISPTLAGPAADHGLPRGVGDAYDSDVIATVAPTILALSRLITETTRSPLTLRVGTCDEPDHSD